LAATFKVRPTDNSGMRILAAVAIASLLLAGCSSTGSDDTPEPVGDFSGLDLAATDTTGIIRGIVVDESIRPIMGARLVLQSEAGPMEALSAEDGVFGYEGLAGGTYFIQASKPGFVSAQVSTDVVVGVAEPAIVKVLLVADPASTPYVQTFVWNGFIECSTRVGTGPTGQGSVGLNACNDVGNQDVNFPVDIAGTPSMIQAEAIWKSTQTFGSGLSFVVGPKNCDDIKWARADGPSSLVIALGEDALASEEDFEKDGGLCYRMFSYVSGESQETLGAVTSQRFDVYFHVFYNFLPPEGWKFSVDGDPVVPV
jgi:hypothetical protein